jgi:hypothetical protein
MRQTRHDLGIQPGQENPYEVLVLSVAQPLHTEGFGDSPNSPPNVGQYVSGLYARGQAFMAEQGSSKDTALPYAWRTVLAGNDYLCISEATACLLLEPASVGYYEPDNAQARTAQSLMRHEYVHTQGNVKLFNPALPKRTGYLGTVLEEYRAEVFSGRAFHDWYGSVYWPIYQVEEPNRLKIGDVMRQHRLGGGGEQKPFFYANLANRIGMSVTAMLTGYMPTQVAAMQSPRSAREFSATLKDTLLQDEVILRMPEATFHAWVQAKPIEDQYKAGFYKRRQRIIAELG